MNKQFEDLISGTIKNQFLYAIKMNALKECMKEDNRTSM